MTDAQGIGRGELDEGADARIALYPLAGAPSHRVLVEQSAVTPAFVPRLVRPVVAGLITNAT